jgi:hypothetical protein
MNEEQSRLANEIIDNATATLRSIAEMRNAIKAAQASVATLQSDLQAMLDTIPEPPRTGGLVSKDSLGGGST